MDVEFVKKINEKSQKATKKALNKMITKNEKKNFRAVLTMQQMKKVEKHYDVFLIAAKIAKGESVSSEELKYIREHAPGLLEDARKQFEEKVERQVKGIENQERPESREENNEEKDNENLTDVDSDLEDFNDYSKDFSIIK
jgi:hypothetical protein